MGRRGLFPKRAVFSVRLCARTPKTCGGPGSQGAHRSLHVPSLSSEGLGAPQGAPQGATSGSTFSCSLPTALTRPGVSKPAPQSSRVPQGWPGGGRGKGGVPHLGRACPRLSPSPTQRTHAGSWAQLTWPVSCDPGHRCHPREAAGQGRPPGEKKCRAWVQVPAWPPWASVSHVTASGPLQETGVWAGPPTPRARRRGLSALSQC